MSLNSKSTIIKHSQKNIHIMYRGRVLVKKLLIGSSLKLFSNKTRFSGFRASILIKGINNLKFLMKITFCWEIVIARYKLKFHQQKIDLSNELIKFKEYKSFKFDFYIYL